MAVDTGGWLDAPWLAVAAATSVRVAADRTVPVAFVAAVRPTEVNAPNDDSENGLADAGAPNMHACTWWMNWVN